MAVGHRRPIVHCTLLLDNFLHLHFGVEFSFLIFCCYTSGHFLFFIVTHRKKPGIREDCCI